MPVRMSLAMATAVAIAVCVATAGAQPPVSFEVASVRPSPEGLPAPGAAAVQITTRQFRAGYLSVKDYLGIVSSNVSGTNIEADLGGGASLSFGNGKFAAKRVTMAALADTLGRFMDRPIVDQTQLEGRYDVVFDVAADDVMPMLIRSGVNAGIPLPPEALRLLDVPSTGSVPDALKKVGLSLDPRRAPLDVLVVDSVQRVPTEN